MIGESLDPFSSTLETNNTETTSGIANVCLSALENPSASKARLRQLLRQVEKEFEAVLIENLALRKELERYGALPHPTTATTGSTTNKLRASNIFPMIRNRVVLRTTNQSDDLLFSSNNQHKDVIWDVQVGGIDGRYLGSTSADKTSLVWSRKTGRALVHYLGHRGSVNSCRFRHVDHDLVLTASGDHEVHIWQWSPDEHKDDEDEDNTSSNDLLFQTIRSPSLALRGDDVISCADWLQRDHVVSASWDRSATLWQVSSFVLFKDLFLHVYFQQVEMGTSLRTLYGHDAELTYVSCHQSKPLVLTSSRKFTRDQSLCDESHSVPRDTLLSYVDSPEKRTNEDRRERRIDSDALPS